MGGLASGLMFGIQYDAGAGNSTMVHINDVRRFYLSDGFILGLTEQPRG